MSRLKALLESRDARQNKLDKLIRGAKTDAGEDRELNEAEEARSKKLLRRIDKLDAAIKQERRAVARKRALAESRALVTVDGDGTNTAPATVQVTSEPMVYGPESRHSWWYDKILTHPMVGHPAGDPLHDEAQQRLFEWGHQVEREIAHRSAKGILAAAQFRDNESYRANGSARRFLEEARARGAASLDSKVEQRTGITTGGGATASAASGGAAFVSPVILSLAQYAPYREYGRPFIDQCNKQPLPDYGMEVYLPHVTGPAGISSQTEATAVDEADPTFGYLSAGLATMAGQVTVSQQQLDRTGPAFNFDRMIFDQLKRDYAPKVDVYTLQQVLAGATSQNWTGNAGAFDLVAASGAGGFYGQVNKAIAGIATTEGTVLRASHLFVIPQRWSVIAAWSDSQGRPVVVPDIAGPFNALAAGSRDGASVIEGRTGYAMAGLPVFTDANIPNLGTTATDQALVGDLAEVWVFEGTPIHRVLPQTLGGTLQTILQQYSYLAVLIRYPAGIVSINGTGMSAPTYTD